jgi:membrane fusion protein, multidrug efflux system
MTETHRARRGSRQGWWKLVALLFLLAWMPLAGCSKDGAAPGAANDSGKKKDSGSKDAEADTEQELVPVETVRLGRGAIEAVLRFSTNLEAESEVQVFSEAARRVVELKVEEGDRVRKGQLLLQLQDDEQKSELAKVESQLRKARREYQRQQSLFQQSLISEQAMNEATYEVEQLELAVEGARYMVRDTEVRAPIAGTVTGRHVNLGDHVTVNQHLFDLVDFDTIVARVYVPENNLAELEVGQEARLYASSLSEAGPGSGDDAPAAASPAEGRTAEAWVGKVARIAPIVDPRSGTVKVTVAIPRNQGLLPGMYVEVELVTDVHDNALLVPKRAVIYDDNQAFLYRLTGAPAAGTPDVEGLRAERLRIDVWLEDRENIEPAPGSELQVGDEIVVAGQAGLKSGVEVRRAGEKKTGSADEEAPAPAAPDAEAEAEEAS